MGRSTPRDPDDDGIDAHAWKQLDPLVRFGAVLAAVLFAGVIIEGIFLVPYALLNTGWTPGGG